MAWGCPARPLRVPGLLPDGGVVLARPAVDIWLTVSPRPGWVSGLWSSSQQGIP